MGFTLSVLFFLSRPLWHCFIDNARQLRTTTVVILICLIFIDLINRGYYTVARRYEFYFRVAKQYFTNERSE